MITTIGLFNCSYIEVSGIEPLSLFVDSLLKFMFVVFPMGYGVSRGIFIV